MRQAGRYQKVYRDLALKHPSFRERSETTDLIVEISLQPWNSFKPDGVIIFRCSPAGMSLGVTS
jgi:uroporphyrinogen decarboxylase